MAAAATVKNSWGNPKASAFRKMHIRRVSVEGATTEVHAEIVALVAEVLRMAAEQGLLPEGAVQGYDPAMKDDPRSAFAYGTALRLPGVDGAEAWGFKRSDVHEDELIFRGGVENARELTALAEEIAAERASHPDIIPEAEESWAHTKPGKRVLRGGSRGDDVQFVQTLLMASDQGGVYDAGTAYMVGLLQEKNGIPVTGEVDLSTWLLLYPRVSAFGLGRGDTGFAVRVAQALLIAYGWDTELEVTGRYGVATDKAIRRLQEQLGFRLSGYMRAAEWVALFGPRDEWPSRETPLDTPLAVAD